MLISNTDHYPIFSCVSTPLSCAEPVIQLPDRHNQAGRVEGDDKLKQCITGDRKIEARSRGGEEGQRTKKRENKRGSRYILWRDDSGSHD
jgi:hypothetical protein